MIEINMLPAERRTKEQTPLPIYLSLVGGVSLLCVFGVLWLMQGFWVESRLEEVGRLEGELTRLTEQADRANEIRAQIAQSQQRLDAVLEINESKIFWYQKLAWLVDLMPDSIWLREASFGAGDRRGGDDAAPVLTIDCATEGRADVWNQLDQALRSHMNFSYHFGNPHLAGSIDDEESRETGRTYRVFTAQLEVQPTPIQEARAAQGGQGGAPAQ